MAAYGGRLELGITNSVAVGLGYSRTVLRSDLSTRTYDGLKAQLFIRLSDRLSASGSLGTLSSPGKPEEKIGDAAIVFGLRGFSGIDPYHEDAKREVIESGLSYWVSLRQTAILHGNRPQPARMDPIMFHVPLRGVFEWVTAEDSGRLLANVCADDVPEHFWRRIYNVGGGAGCRITNYELLLASLTAFGLGRRHLEALFDPKWFALRNFHGQWFEDSDSLEDLLHFRRETRDDFGPYFRRHAPIPAPVVALTPAFVCKIAHKLVLEPFANRCWNQQRADGRIEAFFGSPERRQAIPGWDGLDTHRPSDQPLRLHHGYDEASPPAEFDLDIMKAAAEFRGGRCLSSRMTRGDLTGKLRWQCAFGHEFEASPTLVLLAGHWCPGCLPPPWNDDEIARRNHIV